MTAELLVGAAVYGLYAVYALYALLGGIAVYCGLVIAFSTMIIRRSTWVLARRKELIDWCLAQDREEARRGTNPAHLARHLLGMNQRYGTFDQWVNRWWCWDPAKLAGTAEPWRNRAATPEEASHGPEVRP